MSGARAVLDTWFGASDSPDFGRARRIWFKKDATIDATLSQRFGQLLEQALRGELSSWAEHAEGALALILLLDQFTRNCFRGTPRAYSGDTQALALARTLAKSGEHLMLPTPFHRAFCYMPFEHDEAAASQQEAVRLFEQLATAHSDPDIESYCAYAKKHANVIERFGRFPHRNKILGRESTENELQWLKKNGGF